MYTSKAMRALGRLLYNRKVFGLVAVGSRQVTSIRLRLPVALDRLELYRSLLPPELEMPPAPKIYFYVSEFQGTYPVRIEGGYREAAVCLKACCRLDSRTRPKQGGWHPLEMPVDAQSALNSGLMMGYPKYMAEISMNATDRGGEGLVKIAGKDFFGLRYEPAEIEVAGLDEEELTVPVYLVANGRINIMQNEVVSQTSFSSRSGMISLSVNSQALWTKLLDQPKTTGPGVLKVITGQFNLTRRSR